MISFKKMPVTNTVIGICVIIFLCINYLPLGLSTTEAAILFGAYYKAFISAFEVWRLLTVGLVHIDLWHLFMNMVALYNLGSVLEKYYGSLRFALILVLCTITGSLVSFIGEGNIVLVGLSGGLYGLMAVEIMMIIKSGAIQNPAIRTSLISTLVINLMINFVPGIGVLAHFGGFLMGILLSYTFDVYSHDRKLQRNYQICTIALFLLVCGFSFTKRAIPSSDRYLGTDVNILQFEKDHGLGFYADFLCDKLEALYGEHSVHYYLY